MLLTLLSLPHEDCWGQEEIGIFQFWIQEFPLIKSKNLLKIKKRCAVTLKIILEDLSWMKLFWMIENLYKPKTQKENTEFWNTELSSDWWVFNFTGTGVKWNKERVTFSQHLELKICLIYKNELRILMKNRHD